jgi:hypothetical protein
MSKEQLIEWVLRENPEAESETSGNGSSVESSDTENTSDTATPQEDPKTPVKMGANYFNNLVFPSMLGINAATTILKIIKQIDRELGIEKKGRTRSIGDSEDDDLKKIAMANTNTENRINQHIIVSDEGKLLPGTRANESFLNFYNVINANKDKDAKELNPENEAGLKQVNDALAVAISDDKPNQIDGTVELKGGGSTFTATNDSIEGVMKFLGIINLEKKSLLDRAKEILKKKGGYKSTLTMTDILGDIEGLDNIPENTVIEDIYTLLELAFPEGSQ